ncbi:MAG: rRNA maturation RNase YbeY [Ignavibacteria bacterium GWA2_55_11]|nr:MAG: rRNA maturation RNase YbeY [Ignavibacteria bacterium GWA2_55_11]OGU43589.1 MAG: rRNA maturation RNase YbeY [Ignavibacteria bacterium GWC2_56_12]
MYVGSISVAYVDDRRMRSLNARYLDHRWTTDVLAFSYTTSGAVDGEVVVNLDQARRQAPHFGVRYGDEVRRLLVHGLLHLAGHVDDTPSRRDRMRRREDRYLASLTTRHARTNR